MALALPPGHPLAGRAALPLTELAPHPWVAPHDCGCCEALVAACRAVGFRPRVVAQTTDYLTMLGLVRAGVSVVSRGTGYRAPGVERMVRTVRSLVPALGRPGLRLSPAA